MSHIVGPGKRRHHAIFGVRQDANNAAQKQPANNDPFAADTFDPNSQPTTTAAVADPVATVTTPTTTDTPTPTPTPVAAPATSPSSTTDSSSTLSSISSSPDSSTSTTSTTPSTSDVVSTTAPTTTTPLSPSVLAPTSTFFQTISTQPAAGAASASPTSTNTSAVGGATAGIIAGGIIAAILGTAGVVFALVYFLRKCRRNEDEALSEEIWNRPDARRQSTILPDEPDPPVRSYNAMGSSSPRPPTMIERHLNRAPAMPTYQTPPNMYPNNGYGAGYGATQYGQPSFSPGDVVSPTSANAFISPYSQDVMTSPVSSNVPDYHDLPSPVSPAVPHSALIRHSSSSMGQAALVRQNSVTGGPHSPVDASPNAIDPHYVDLSRSSVTPFQAAQYAEITEKLGTPMDSVMVPTPVVLRDDASSNRTLVPHTPHTNLSPQDQKALTDSPFADPGTNHPDNDASHELDIEVPLPTPVLLEHSRVTSTPPMLPEIQVPERSFSPVASFEFPVPLSARETPSPFSLEFSDARTPPPAGLKYKNSPLATSSPTQAQPTVIPHESKTGAQSSRRDSVHTLYEEEDAYGGI